MDILSIVGLVLAVNAVLLGAVLRGAGLAALISMEAFMVVGVCTIAATCIQTPLPVMKHALKIFPWIVRPTSRDGRQIIRSVIKLVEELETTLASLTQLSGDIVEHTTLGENPDAGHGPVVPGVTRGEVATGQTDVDELLSGLGM